MNKSTIITVAISLIIGLAGGYGLAFALGSNEDESGTNMVIDHAHDDTGDTMAESSMEHMHDDMFEVSAENAPTVDFTVGEDEKSGWNIALSTENFEFTPDKVNQDNVEGEGHAHLYVDGEKVARLYSPYFHYDGKFDGTKTFKVTLNANDHSEYSVDGETIVATKEVTHNNHN